MPTVTKPGEHLALHSSVANVNPGQVLRVWRNATDGFVYVSLPGGLLPGPYRVLQRGKRHVVDSAPVRALTGFSLLHGLEGMSFFFPARWGCVVLKTPHIGAVWSTHRLNAAC